MSWAADINDAGQVVGSSHVAGGRKVHAFFWQNGAMSDLGALAGGFSYASRISDAGLIVGSSSDSQGRSRAVLWRDRVIGTLDVGGAESATLGVNNAEQMVGYLGSGRHFDYHAFLWRAGAGKEIGSFIARSINQAGQIAGDEAEARTSSAVVYRDGVIRKLPTPGRDDQSRAYAINDKGQIVGVCSSASGGEAAVLWDGGKVNLLGTLGGRVGYAFALNNRGQVVGAADTARGERHAFLWQNDTMIDLNDTLPRNSGWVLVSANGVNQHGQIVGWGEHDRRQRAFLLTPKSR